MSALRLLAFAFFTFFTQAHPASAADSGQLMDDCTAALEFYGVSKPADPYRALQGARCLAYLDGLIDGQALGDYLATQVGVRLNAWCLPQGDDQRYRTLRAVVSHLEKQPPGSTATPRTLVAGALSRAFPCEQ